jgi:hypothetical protein
MEWRGGKEEAAEKLLEILPRVRWGRCGLGGRSGQNITRAWGRQRGADEADTDLS